MSPNTASSSASAASCLVVRWTVERSQQRRYMFSHAITTCPSCSLRPARALASRSAVSAAERLSALATWCLERRAGGPGGRLMVSWWVGGRAGR
eukprot:scaffold8279_cov116-Isochrysis_galbana.AAC.4